MRVFKPLGQGSEIEVTTLGLRDSSALLPIADLFIFLKGGRIRRAPCDLSAIGDRKIFPSFWNISEIR